MRIAIIHGSSRSYGNTADLAKNFEKRINNNAEKTSYYDLANFDINHYDYEFKNQDDDFMSLIEEVIIEHDIILLASPIYWYAPSGRMKIFLDRLTDLMEINKPLGRLLKTKSAGVISTGYIDKHDGCFEEIFSRTFNHLHIDYLGILYCSYANQNNATQIELSITNFINNNLTVKELTPC